MNRSYRNNKPNHPAFDANAPLPPLQPYRRCQCLRCSECISNEKWDRLFAKFEVKEHGDERSWFRSPLSDL